MRLLFLVLHFAVLIAASQSSLAAFSETLKQENFLTSSCNIGKMDIDFRIDEAFGEPLITSKMRWSAGPNTADDCLSPLTQIWVTVRTTSDTLVYVKLSPEIRRSGEAYGVTATESPSWSVLFCRRPIESASCETTAAARQLFGQELRFEAFEVITEARALTNLSKPVVKPSAVKEPRSADAISLDDMLSDAIDGVVRPSGGSTPSEPEVPQFTAEQLEAQIKAQRDEQARVAMNNVVNLIASSFAEYQTPAHACESDRTIANWVQVRGPCQLNFQSETNHQYLCSEDGQSRDIRSTKRANLDLAKDLRDITAIRVSNNGWASLVLELASDLQRTTEGEFDTNRWQFTADSQQIDDLKLLGGSLLTLKQYCESNSSQGTSD